MEMLAFGCLAIVWAAFLVPPMLRKHREGRPASSVVDFRRQLSTLERATPGTTLRPAAQSHLPVSRAIPAPAAQVQRSQVVKRRRDVLVGLAGSAAFTLLLALVATSTLTVLLFLATGGALGAYVYALVQIRRRAEEASVKVRVLRPRQIAPSALSVRHSASN